MKRIMIMFFAGVALLGTSCKKYLNINDNPNSPVTTVVTPELLLPQALAYTANNLNGFNSYGAQLGGFMANAGGYGGFGVSITYNFGTGNFNNLWAGSYDNLEDYQAIIDKAVDKPEYSYYSGAARIMRAHNFQLLVDAYNDIPYSQALKGAEILSPVYDDAKVIYKDLADQLDLAIQEITTGEGTPGVRDMGAKDILFGGNMTNWKKFANTIKLRLLVRGNGKVTFTNNTFSSDGFLTTDALINPGYVRDNGKQSPKWNSWAFSSTGAAGNKAWMPTTFVLTYYNGVKLADPGRGAATFYLFPATPTNRLGYESTGVTSSPDGSFWFPSTSRTGSSAGNATGTLKGPDAGAPVLTAAESYFLQSEAVLRGILTSGDAEALFYSGILASYKYLYSLPDKTISGDPTGDFADYLDLNDASKLVNFSLTTSLEEKIEAIITQKYIALNMVNSEEAWNEYRRTGYPKLNNSASATATETFASLVSESTRPDHLPSRILYPTSEGSYNSANVPKNISPFSSNIFWAQ